MDKADEARLRAILFALTEPRLDDPILRDKFISYLQHESPLIVAEAVDSLRRQGDKAAVDQILGLRQHSSPYVHGSVLRFMAHLHSEKALPLLIEALRNPHFIVRENAADELGQLGAVEAIPHLRPLLNDAHPDVRQAVQTAIEILESRPTDEK